MSAGVTAGLTGGLGFGMKATSTDQSVDINNTDTSRENRETKSRTTAFSQMYQLFNGYHLGTNRDLFVVAPRPHTASDAEQTEFNLIDGQRKLEGVQEVFLVVEMPKKLTGFCVQASIDTGHTVMVTHTMAKENPILPNGGPGDPGNQPPPPHPPPPGKTYNELVVTRRMVQNCGTFDVNGNFVVTGVPDIVHPGVVVTWEDGVLAKSYAPLSERPFDTTKSAKVDLANQMNITQWGIIKSMISGFSAGNFEPIEFTKSKTFSRQIKSSIQNLEMPISTLVELNYLTQDQAALLMRLKIMTIGDVFNNNLGQSSNPDIQRLRGKILEKFGVK